MKFSKEKRGKCTSSYKLNLIRATLLALIATVNTPWASAQTFNPEVVIDSFADGVRSVTATDMDNDGDIDVLAAAYYAHDVMWYENDGQQNFTKYLIDGNFTYVTAIKAADVDGDGNMDVLAASYTLDDLVWYKNDGQENFTKLIIDGNVDGIYNSIATADLDNDGDVDVVSSSIGDDDVNWYENDGSGNFTKNTINASANNPYGMNISDLDSDGDVDILVSSYSGSTIYWYRNDGGTFTLALTKTISSPIAISGVDMDADGDKDLLVELWGLRDIYWYENDGNNQFNSGYQIHPGNNSFQFAPADFDLDGDMDFATGYYSGAVVRLFENDGNQNFAATSLNTGFSQSWGIEAVDLDLDGDLDLLAASLGSDKVSWFENTTDPVLGPEAEILSFSLPGQIGESTIDQVNLTIDINFSDTTDITSLAATFTLSDTANAYIAGQLQQSGVTINDFSSPVIYSIYAADSSVINNYTVTAYLLGMGTDILSYSIPAQMNPLVIDAVNHTITGTASSTTDLHIATFTLSAGATVTVSSAPQQSGTTSNNYASPVIYTITAEDGITTQDWTVDIQVLSPETDVLSFSLPGQLNPAVINATSHTTDLQFSDVTDRSSLVATYTLSIGAQASVAGQVQQSGVTANDFSSSVVYTILAEDSVTTQDWTVNIQTLSSATDFNTYVLPGSLKPSAIDAANHTINLDFLEGTDLSTIVAAFGLSAGAGATISGLSQTTSSTINNFSTTLTYTILAEDQVTSQNWGINVNLISLCDHLAGLGLECDPVESKLNVEATIAGSGLTWSSGVLSVTDNDNFNLAYNERGSVIGGTGLLWNGTALDVDGDSLAGEGLAWTGSSFEFDATNIISTDFVWDPIAKKLSLQDGAASIFTKIDDSSIYFSAPTASDTRVGIGTSNIPLGYMLAVGGNVIANLVKVQLPAEWPDYVFEEGYDLLPLKRLSQYINEHKHLPGIPSAEEVEQEGIDLGVMNALLLEKIEELTLYSIDQEKRLLLQKETVEKLIKRNAKILKELEIKENGNH